jgi:hypothetical protein
MTSNTCSYVQKFTYSESTMSLSLPSNSEFESDMSSGTWIWIDEASDPLEQLGFGAYPSRVRDW